MQYYKRLVVNMQNKKYKILLKLIKKDNNYKQYKHCLKHPVVRFTFSYIVSFFEQKRFTDKQIQSILNFEYELIHNSSKSNFKKIFSNIPKFIPVKYSKVHWEEFGIYFYYMWQTSRFYYDKKKKIPNIYIDNDYIAINRLKRTAYYKWLDSLKKQDLHFNTIVLYIKKKGL